MWNVSKYKICDCFLEYTKFRDNLIEQKFFCCNKSYQWNFDKNLTQRFVNTCKFSNNNINQFILLLL